MGRIRRSTLIGLTLLLTWVAGCKVSCTTANISSFKISKDEEANVETKEFAPTDVVYAKATVSNSASNITLKFRLIAEKVEGLQENFSIPNTEKSLDLPSSGYATYHVKPPTSGWPAGRYRIEVVMLYSGDEKDKKSDTFTVKGGSATAPSSAATPSPRGNTTPAQGDEGDSDNSNSH